MLKPIALERADPQPIELWDGTRKVATIYVTAATVHVACEPGYLAEFEPRWGDPKQLAFHIERDF